MKVKLRRYYVCSFAAGVLFFLTSPLYATYHHYPHAKHHQQHHHQQHHHQHHQHQHHHRSHSRHPIHHDLASSTPDLAMNAVCSTAKSELGKPYVWGGDTPSDGFDCSGFSQYVYEKEGLRIPRTAMEQFASLTPVHHLEDGDLVFFKTFGRRVSHVGIYLGNGYFIHSPKTGEDIRIDNIHAPYWRERYAGARRVLTNQA